MTLPYGVYVVFYILYILLVFICLFNMVLKSSVEVLFSVPKYKKPVVCFMKNTHVQ